MSLETWKAEFYPIPASEVKKEDAIAHSLQKWKGLTQINMGRHELTRESYRVLEDRNRNTFEINAVTCALCVHYIRDDDKREPYCLRCPLYKVLGYNCDSAFSNSPYASYVNSGNPEPMILALEKALADNHPSTETNLRDESGTSSDVSHE